MTSWNGLQFVAGQRTAAGFWKECPKRVVLQEVMQYRADGGRCQYVLIQQMCGDTGFVATGRTMMGCSHSVAISVHTQILILSDVSPAAQPSGPKPRSRNTCTRTHR